MKKILIVIDMQNDFIDGSLGSADAQAIVPNVIEKINNWKGFVIATRDTHGSDYCETLEGKKLPVSHCQIFTEGWEVNADVKAALESHGAYMGTWNKETFGCVSLHNIVKSVADIMESEEAEFTLVGLDTDICVVSNALLLRAHYPNTRIVVDSSCCAGTSPEAHNAALTVMRSCQIDVE